MAGRSGRLAGCEGVACQSAKGIKAENLGFRSGDLEDCLVGMSVRLAGWEGLACQSGMLVD